MIRITDEQFWLYAAVDPDTNHVPHIHLYPRRTKAITETFLAESQESATLNGPSFSLTGRRGSEPAG